MPTLNEVARRAGVSRATASYALNGTKRLSPATLERVRQAARELGYVPDHAARSLRTNETRTVALLVRDLLPAAVSDLVRGISYTLIDAGYGLLVHMSEGGWLAERRFLGLAAERRVKGLVWLPVGEAGHLAREFSYPLVLLDATEEALAAAHAVVTFAYGPALQETAQLVARQQVGEVAFVAEALPSPRRQLLYREWDQALRRAGLVLLPEAAKAFPTGDVGGYKAAIYLSRLTRPPGAVFLSHPSMVLGFLHGCREAGYHPTVVSFMDRRTAITYPWPIICLELPWEEAGVRAARALLDPAPAAVQLPVHVSTNG